MSRPLLARLLPFVLSIAFVACDSADKKPADTTQTDTQQGDSQVTDTAEPDTAQPDTAQPDTAQPDTAQPEDTSTADTTAADTSTADTTAADTSTADTSTADTADGDTTSATCSAPEECTYCAFATAPKTVADCFCPICPTTPMTATECAANSAAWESVCGGDAWHDTANCPVPRCVPLPDLTCKDGACVEGCNTDACPALLCPVEEQVTPPGECCPRCAGESSCTQDEDCVMCAFGKPVSKPEDCYCVFCPSTPMTASQCTTNQKSWAQHCDPWPLETMCPQPMCLPGAEPVCDAGGQCTENPNRCFTADDCGSCQWTEAPTNAAECHCPGCPQPLRTETCQEIQATIDDVCADFDFSKCALPSCARPPAITCTPDQTCGYMDILIEPEPR